MDEGFQRCQDFLHQKAWEGPDWSKLWWPYHSHIMTITHFFLKMINGDWCFSGCLGPKESFIMAWWYITHCNKQLRWSTRPLWKQERQSQDEYDRRTLIVVIAKSRRVCLKWCIALGVKHPSNLTISFPQPELSVFRRHLHHSPLGSPISEDRQILPILSARQHKSPHQDLWRSRAKRQQQCWMSWG